MDDRGERIEESRAFISIVRGVNSEEVGHAWLLWLAMVGQGDGDLDMNQVPVELVVVHIYSHRGHVRNSMFFYGYEHSSSPLVTGGGGAAGVHVIVREHDLFGLMIEASGRDDFGFYQH